MKFNTKENNIEVTKEVREVKVYNERGHIVDQYLAHTGNANYTVTTAGVVKHNINRTVRSTVHSLRKKNEVREMWILPAHMKSNKQEAK